MIAKFSGAAAGIYELPLELPCIRARRKPAGCAEPDLVTAARAA
jgi:hypothetical protein